MNIKNIYLGTWFQRTSLHLEEIYNFLKFKKGIPGLDQTIIEDNWKKLKLENLCFHKETEFDFLEFFCGHTRITITEDGIILMSRESEDDFLTDLKKITDYYSGSLGPAIAYLFSRGAPLPKELNHVSEIYPILITGIGMEKKDIDLCYKQIQDSTNSIVSHKELSIYLGNKMNILNFDNVEVFQRKFYDEIIRHLVFFREFEIQLEDYLHLHRNMWEKVSIIREKREIRYRDFPRVREEILDFLKTLSFVKARLAQMYTILEERESSINPEIRKILVNLGFDRYKFLRANEEYIEHLWQMTIEYVEGTFDLLRYLYEENTQRELGTLKYITLIGVLTSFFGMNIAFPWEERWPNVFDSSLEVVLLIFVIAICFYFFLKFFIYNRSFRIKRK